MIKLAYPKNIVRITQTFTGEAHPGIDIGGTKVGDTMVYAVGEGIVRTVGYGKSFGNYVVTYHPDYDMSCLYLHLKEVYVKEDEILSKGKNHKIGVEGNTGNSTGAHLHFGMYRGEYTGYRDNYVNPFAFLHMYNEQHFYYGEHGNEVYADEVLRNYDNNPFYELVMKGKESVELDACEGTKQIYRDTLENIKEAIEEVL